MQLDKPRCWEQQIEVQKIGLSRIQADEIFWRHLRTQTDPRQEMRGFYWLNPACLATSMQNPPSNYRCQKSNTREWCSSSQSRNARLMERIEERQWKSKRIHRKWLGKIHGIHDWKSMVWRPNQRHMQMRLSRIHIVVRLATCNILILTTAVDTCLDVLWDQVGFGPLEISWYPLRSLQASGLERHYLKKLGEIK